MPDSRVFLRVGVTRDALRTIDARASAAKVSREAVAAELLAQSLDGPAAEPRVNLPEVPTASGFARAVFSDAVRAQPGLAPVLLRLLGGDKP